MPLTPIDVQQKTFGTALRGYDLDEVDDFLDEIVTSLKDYEQRLRDAQDRISTLESEMADRGDAEGAISRALVAAQRSADAIVEEARAEAAQVVSDAQARAEEIGIEHENELASARAEVDRLRGTVDDMRRQVRALTADLDATLGQMDEAITDGETQLTAEEAATPAVDDEPASYESLADGGEDDDDLQAQDETEEGSYSAPYAEEVSADGGEEDEESFAPVPESSPLDRLPSIEELEAGPRSEDSPDEDAELAVTSESEDTYDPMYDTGERASRPWEQ